MNEVAIPTTTDIEVAPVVLDEYAALVEQEKFLESTIKEWIRQHKEIKDKIREIMGNSEEATFAGRPAYTNKRIERINETDFKKELPNVHHAYSRLVEKSELDVDLLKKAQPEIYERFQVRQFKRVG